MRISTMAIVLYIILGTALLLIFLVLGIEWWLAAKIRRMARKELVELVGDSVQLEIARVRVSLLKRSVTLREITITAGPVADGAARLPVDSLSAAIDKITVRGFRSRGDQGTAGRSLSLQLLEIENPNVKLVLKDCPNRAEVDEHADSEEKSENRTLQALGEALAARIGTVTAGQIRVRGANLRVTNGSRNCYAAKGAMFEVDRFSTAKDATQRPFMCGDIRFSAAKASVRFMQTAQLLEAEKIRLGMTQRSVSLRNVRLIPQHGKAEYAWKVARHTDWTQVIVGSVDVQGVDFDRLWRETLLQVDSIRVEKLDVASYKNRRIVRQERFKPMVHEMIQDVPFGLLIRKLEVVQAHAVYEELSASGAEPGRISFDHVNGVFRDVTNCPGDEGDYFTLIASGKVMDLAQLRVVLRFPAHASNDRFEVEGTMGPLDLRLLNGVLEPLSEAAIRSGQLDGLAFDITGTRSRAQVDMKMRYRDLSLTMLREDAAGRKRERRLMSSFVNLMLIKGANPDRKGLRVVRHVVVRDTTRSQFNYLWKTLLAGIRGSVGFPGSAATLEPEGDVGSRPAAGGAQGGPVDAQRQQEEPVHTAVSKEIEASRPSADVASAAVEGSDGEAGAGVHPETGDDGERLDAK